VAFSEWASYTHPNSSFLFYSERENCTFLSISLVNNHAKIVLSLKILVESERKVAVT
jgi:hypothetical protein